MPARNIYHNCVKHALTRAGWNITRDPYRIRLTRKNLFVDLGAERLIAADHGTEKIAIEVKSFTRASDIKDMNSATIDYQSAIRQLFDSYISFLGEADGTKLETVIDPRNNRYLLIESGWQNGHRIYGTLFHIDVINGKLWIQHDGTEDGIANELVELGVPKDKIVLGFKPSDRRALTEFAFS